MGVRMLEAEFGAHQVIGLYVSGECDSKGNKLPQIQCACGYYKDVIINNGYKWICNQGCVNERIAD
jgi:hypothetical protein